MNAAKDRKATSIHAYLDGRDRQALLENARYTEDMSIKIAPAMLQDIKTFAERHGVNLSQVLRACVNEALPRLDAELTRKARDLSR